MTNAPAQPVQGVEAVAVSQPYHGARFIISFEGGSLNGMSYPSAEAAQADLDRIRSGLIASPAPAPEAPAGISTHQVWLDRVADRALQLGRRPTRAEILMCVSEWAALATQADDTKGGA